MRPEENSRLRWESVGWSNGHCGTLQVTHGKTAAARRMLPLSPRVRALLERRWEAAKMPSEGWVWATATASGHIEPSTVKKQHQRALRLSGVRPFVLYALYLWATHPEHDCWSAIEFLADEVGSVHFFRR